MYVSLSLRNPFLTSRVFMLLYFIIGNAETKHHTYFSAYIVQCHLRTQDKNILTIPIIQSLGSVVFYVLNIVSI